MNSKTKGVPATRALAQVFKPFANRTVEEELKQVQILLEQATDQDAAKAYRDLMTILEDELRFSETPGGRQYYTETPAGHLRVTSDIVMVPTKSIVRDPELQSLFPPLPDAEYEDLRQSVANHGLLNALLVTHEDKLICGYNRLRVCEDLGLSTVPVRRRYCATPDHAKAIAIADNLIRRHFSPSESIRTIQALEMIGPISLPEVAQKMHMSVRIVRRLKNVGESLIPEFKSLIDGEEIPLRKAEVIAGLPKETQLQIYEIFKATKKVPSDAVMQEMRKHLEIVEAQLKAKQHEILSMQEIIDAQDKTLSDRGRELQELRTLQSETEMALQDTRRQLHQRKTEEQNYADKLKRIQKESLASGEQQVQDAVLERMFDTAMYTVVNFRKTLFQARAKQTVTPAKDREWTEKLTKAVAEFAGKSE
jgi:ParB-like chromosome segregation protein Spo0J